MLLFRIMMLAILTVTMASSQALDGCPSKCGDVNIPYPFGIGGGCYLNPIFNITCNSTGNSSTPLLRKGPIEVINITLEGELRVYTYVGSNCKDNQNRDWNSTEGEGAAFASLSAFSFSSTRNKFTAFGCNTLATISILNGDNSSSGCLSMCNNQSVSEGLCDGFGCCQTAIPRKLRWYSISVRPYREDVDVRSFSPCNSVFIGEDSSFTFSRDNLANMNGSRVRTVIDWAVPNMTCVAARKNLTSYGCKAANSECYEPVGINGYRCNCFKGYKGNPYLPNGCEDVDECGHPDHNDCVKICQNTIGGYTCSCPRWFQGDGKSDGTGCSRDYHLLIKITVGVSVGVTVLMSITGLLYLAIKKRNLVRLKEKYFKQNGGQLLQRQVRDGDASSRSGMRIFTAEELKKATDNYSETRILGRGGYGTVYKGVLPDDTVVAIKKSKEVDRTQIEQFVNELIVLSQINHRNVIKLLGCCFETAVPLLVYEFVGNGTLFEQIHDQVRYSKMSWETRMRIAAETAGVLSYLHSAASVPIIHRDIKSANILLDENCVAKVSDFGTSRLVPLDQTAMSTMVQGTLGYLDPEYLSTSTLTEKSDVYSFGVVLVELLTGKMALSFDKPEKERCLAMYFLSSLKEDRLFQIVEDSVAKNDCDAQQVKEVAELAKRCLRVKGEERPTMKEVAMELEGIRLMANHPWVAVQLNPEETENLLGVASDSIAYSDTSATYDSMRNQVMPAMAGGR